MVKVKVFILNKRGNILRYLKESRTERKESRLDMAGAREVGEQETMVEIAGDRESSK